MSLENPTEEEIKEYFDFYYYKQWENYRGLDKDFKRLLSCCKFSLEEIINVSLFRFLKYSKENFDWLFWDEERNCYTRIMDADYKIIGHLLSRPTKNVDDYSYESVLQDIIYNFLYRRDCWIEESLAVFAEESGQNLYKWDDFDFVEFFCSYCLESELLSYIGHLPFDRLSGLAK